MKIELPWPDSRLLPNRRNGQHWSATQDAKQRAKTDATWATQLAMTDRANGRIVPAAQAEVTIICNPPDSRRRDVDGILSSLKPSLDAIAATLGIDDRMFNPIIVYREQALPGGCVTVIIDQVPF